MQHFALLFIWGVYDQVSIIEIGNVKLSAKVAVKIAFKRKNLMMSSSISMLIIQRSAVCCSVALRGLIGEYIDLKNFEIILVSWEICSIS